MTVSATVLALVLVGLPLSVVGVPSKQQKVGEVDRQPNFNAASYLGKWYEIYRTKNMPFEVGTDNEANYALNPNGTVAVRNLEWRTDHWSEALAVATIIDNARLSVDFFMGPPGDYQVMRTDYETYAIVYSFGGKVGSRVLEFGWILSRQTSLPQSLINQAFELFEAQTSLKRSDFLQTLHGVAPYPPPAANARAGAADRKAKGQGQGEGEVDRQPNFDTVSYLGRWFEIYRSKNMPFEVGTDNEANYALNPNGTVAVRNLEWRFDKWAEALAVATVVDNARLTVDFFFGTPGDYQVMKTDYETFAFVYSYAGKIGSRKIQYGWILARQTSLPQSLIDQAFQLFEEQAGMKRSDFLQTQHGVAPYPPPAAKALALARKAKGQVQDQRQGAGQGEVDRQPNFDAESYLGSWFEIYRSKNMPFEFGTDNVAHYALNPNGTVAVRNLEWRFDKWADVRGVATIVDNARLSVDFFMGPPGDYQVMKTDYDTYAVVYSYAGKIGSRKLQYGWILARETSLAQSIVDQAFDLFEEQAGMKRSDFVQTKHGVAAYPAPEAFSKTQ